MLTPQTPAANGQTNGQTGDQNRPLPTHIPAQGNRPECLIAPLPVDYEQALAFMETRVAEIRNQQAGELLWFLEHPALYTAGTSAKPEELLAPEQLPVYKVGRGGKYTYHGPGQRVVYVMLDLQKRGADIKRFVANIENWMITALHHFDIHAHRRDGEIGVWVRRPQMARDDKIGAIGVKIRRWVSFHGLSLNVNPCLEHFNGIVPCGLPREHVTSLADLGVTASMTEVDTALLDSFETAFSRNS